MDRSTVSRWNERFREGPTNVKDGQRSASFRTATDDSYVAIVATIIEGDRRLTCFEIAEEDSISVKSFYRIINLLNKKCTEGNSC